MAGESLLVGMEFSYNFVSLLKIDPDPAKLHLEDRALKGFRELVSASGGRVEIGLDNVEDLAGYHRVETVVNPQLLRFGGGRG